MSLLDIIQLLNFFKVVSQKLKLNEMPQSFISDAPTKTTKGPAKVPQPKQLFPKKRMAPSNKDNTRSPLATRTLDMNSPRILVQQKQSKNIESQKAKSCALEAVSRSMNKENMNMNMWMLDGFVNTLQTGFLDSSGLSKDGREQNTEIDLDRIFFM